MLSLSSSFPALRPWAGGLVGALTRSEGHEAPPQAPEARRLDQAMDRYAQGHDGAFAEIHAALAGRLRAFLQRMCRSPQLAQDLLQETFLRMHRARGSFMPGAPVVPWAYAIARNVHLDHARAQASRPEAVDGDGRDPAAGPEADAEQVHIARQAATVVERTLARLPHNQREAFVLLRYEGMSVAEAAAILGATEGAVKLRAFHAYEALRRALAIEKSPERRR